MLEYKFGSRITVPQTHYLGLNLLLSLSPNFSPIYYLLPWQSGTPLSWQFLFHPTFCLQSANSAVSFLFTTNPIHNSIFEWQANLTAPKWLSGTLLSQLLFQFNSPTPLIKLLPIFNQRPIHLLHSHQHCYFGRR
nr:hypothetical protein CFP56_51972 [Quercus suber]